MAHKRSISWSYQNTANPTTAAAINQLNFHGPIKSLSNWELWSPPELKNRLTFRPMVHDPSRFTSAEWASTSKSTRNAIIHFYNEPERIPVSPSDAAQAWTSKMLPLRHENRGNRLVSPSVAGDSAGASWLHKWMDMISSKDAAAHKPDFLGLHYYGTSSAAIIACLTSMHDKYHLPVIVSEWACTSRDEHEVLQFTVAMTDWMDRTDWVFEYTLFGLTAAPVDGFVSPAAQLMRGDRFTPLMRKYMDEVPMKL
ncbi:hypothetical protein AAFC00_002794 [Neodothiora populina]|uniref:Asl1-like glycosyl hydrolase catalytic domain-containing protein n=1 Tax=Neodothiora populina TaxID=2781224 RepID=A0ABR3P903_9PEZI